MTFLPASRMELGFGEVWRRVGLRIVAVHAEQESAAAAETIHYGEHTIAQMLKAKVVCISCTCPAQ